MRNAWIPKDMKEAPLLDEIIIPGPVIPKHVLLINPFYAKDPNSSFGKHVLTPSLALTSIAGATPKDWTVHYWDENLLQGAPPYDPFPQVVGISVHLTFARRAYAISEWYRKRGALVIMGGLHIQSCPDEALPHADAIVLGNGVAIWDKILRDIRQGDLKRVYMGSYKMDFKDEPAPRRDVLPSGSFLTTHSMIATRGCNNRCSFCYLSTKGFFMPKQCKQIDHIVQGFKKSRFPYGVFTDNNLGADRVYLRQLCLALKPVNKIWSAAVTIDISDDVSLVKEMALAGCTGVFIGLESLNDQNLRDSHKLTPKTSEYSARVKIFHSHGIQVNGSFVFGFENDKMDVFDRTIEWIEKVGLECATFHILTPYPGTPLFGKMEAEGRLLHKNWDLYDTSHAVFKPKHMTPEELEQGYAKCYRHLFSHASIWQRRPPSAKASVPYLAMAYLYKRSNHIWHFLIRHRLTSMIWRPMVEVNRLMHLRFRKKLLMRSPKKTAHNFSLVSPGV